jgi:hypothetical protein
MIPTAIHVVPDDNFDDWIVRDDDGHELGHYPTREVAELVAEPVARKRRGDVVIHIPEGRTSRQEFRTRGIVGCSRDGWSSDRGSKTLRCDLAQCAHLLEGARGRVRISHE